jgi:hypothetical protein
MPTAIVARKTDGPDTCTALGEDTAIAAYRLVAPRARPDGERAAADAPSGRRAATVCGDECARYGKKVSARSAASGPRRCLSGESLDAMGPASSPPYIADELAIRKRRETDVV